jgi:hypothetical protein
VFCVGATHSGVASRICFQRESVGRARGALPGKTFFAQDLFALARQYNNNLDQIKHKQFVIFFFRRYPQSGCPAVGRVFPVGRGNVFASPEEDRR